ncbi:MAG: hypothetical protein EAZ53_10475 [Bacteroidetes bacterium]|nr:MAG: hypothetical protein EAZ53_10475 [Bacteroidota bacterium]
MLQQTLSVPEKDYKLFLEVAKRFRWKVKTPLKNNMDAPIFDKKTLAMLDERSKVSNNLCLTAEESLRLLNEL